MLKNPETDKHFRRPEERAFTAKQRGRTTVLFGGLPWKHELLIKGALENLAYTCQNLPTPDIDSYHTGREYGNTGQCNPTYFTVGNLIKYLKELEAQGKTRDEIISDYVFITAGSCGPCRFGMYEAEYRLALHNAGFNQFRVLLFQQTEGLNQSQEEAGLELSVDFFLSIINAIMIADLINGIEHKIKPYEVNKGETERVVREVMEQIYSTFKSKRHFTVRGRMARYMCTMKTGGKLQYIGKFVNQLYGKEYLNALKDATQQLNAIEIDRFRIKPVVKITGEFWAQTTEGDGNFRMFDFLEKEGAEIITSPVSNWITYLLYKAKQAAIDRKGLAEKGEDSLTKPAPLRRLMRYTRFLRKIAIIDIGLYICNRVYNRYIGALGHLPRRLIDQKELERLAHPFFHSRSDGGEGHLEVAKNIYYTEKKLAHMVLSLKPFGCLPSTQSDGAQAAVVSHYKDMIFLPIETSGEGEVNAHSRVQMALGEAKVKAKKEFSGVILRTGLAIHDLKAYAEKHPEFNNPFHIIPRSDKITGSAANFVEYIGSKILQSTKKAPYSTGERVCGNALSVESGKPGTPQPCVLKKPKLNPSPEGEGLSPIRRRRQ